MYAVFFNIFFFAGILFVFPACMIFMCSPIGLFTSDLSNKEFNVMMDLIFNDPNLKIDEYRVVGGGYNCWIANSYYGFSVNDEKHFSAWQKFKFFRVLKKHVRTASVKADRLHKQRLQDKIFESELEGKLDDQN